MAVIETLERDFESLPPMSCFFYNSQKKKSHLSLWERIHLNESHWQGFVSRVFCFPETNFKRFCLVFRNFRVFCVQKSKKFELFFKIIVVKHAWKIVADQYFLHMFLNPQKQSSHIKSLIRNSTNYSRESLESSKRSIFLSFVSEFAYFIELYQKNNNYFTVSLINHQSITVVGAIWMFLSSSDSIVALCESWWRNQQTAPFISLL